MKCSFHVIIQFPYNYFLPCMNQKKIELLIKKKNHSLIALKLVSVTSEADQGNFGRNILYKISRNDQKSCFLTLQITTVDVTSTFDFAFPNLETGDT